MRQHIGKALQTRSAAIKSALERYNAAASALIPPRRTLDWNEVVAYTFLAEFDLLRDSRQDISQRPWATPAGRMAMDLYFRLSRAPEEIGHLNIEIRRVSTFLQDEQCYLQTAKKQILAFDASLAYQVRLRRIKHEQFRAHHEVCLAKIAKLDGFSGTLTPGVSIENTLGASSTIPNIRPSADLTTVPPLGWPELMSKTQASTTTPSLPTLSSNSESMHPPNSNLSPILKPPDSPRTQMDADEPTHIRQRVDVRNSSNRTASSDSGSDSDTSDSGDSGGTDTYEGGGEHSVEAWETMFSVIRIAEDTDVSSI